MVTVRHEIFQNIGFSVGIEAKNDMLNIPIFEFKLISLKEVPSRKKWRRNVKGTPLGTAIYS